MIPYFWQYLPLLMQIVAALLLGLGMVVASWFVGRHRNTVTKLASYECGIVAVGDARGRFSVRFTASSTTSPVPGSSASGRCSFIWAL
jgi:NADH-quinone oxidoreductase subunit A